MEVKIGVQNAVRELVVDSTLSGEEIEQVIGEALSGKSELLALTDARGRKVMVPTAKLAYVEVGAPAAGQVGFRS